LSILNKLASSQDRRDDILNQQLAKELIKNNNIIGIKELAGNLFNKDKNIQNDCIKVLYEVGYDSPDLIKEHADCFLKLLNSKNNRLVWGAMIALSTIAALSPKKLMDDLDLIIKTTKNGSVITEDAGIKTLSILASISIENNNKIFPLLIEHLKYLKPKQIPMHAEFILKAVNENNKNAFIEVLKSREDILTDSQKKRIKKILKNLYKNE